MTKQTKNTSKHREPLALITIGITVFLTLSFASYSPMGNVTSQYPTDASASNICGPVGDAIAHYCYLYFGYSIYLLIGSLLIMALRIFQQTPLTYPLIRLSALYMGVIFFSGFLSTFSNSPSFLPSLGGVWGALLSDSFVKMVGIWGARLLCLIITLAIVPYTVEVSLADIYKFLLNNRPSMPKLPTLPKPSLKTLSNQQNQEKAIPAQEPTPNFDLEIPEPQPIEEIEEPTTKPTIAPQPESEPTDTAPLSFTINGPVAPEPKEEETPTPEEDIIPEPPRPTPSVRLRNHLEEKPKPTPKPALTNTIDAPSSETQDLEEYQLPPLNLLNEGVFVETATADEITEKARILEQVMSDFKVEAKVVQVNKGPTITQFELRIASGIKVQKISTLSSNLAMALKATKVRVVAPIPGKDTIGVEIPNTKKKAIYMRPLMEANEEKIKEQYLPIILGEDETGQALVCDLAKLPHLLIAGSTGSGKSVCINAIIQSLIIKRRPDEVKLILVDPKTVEMADYQFIPHLMTPVVTDMAKANAVLEWACKKMEERYKFLARCRVRNIASFNNLGKEAIVEALQKDGKYDPAKDTTFKMPYIVMIIDELADLMMLSANEVEASITRLAQKSRAVGIHVILATQRPSTDVVTGLIKANMPARLAFQVISSIDSRTILDSKGAEQLLGQGDMLYMPPSESRLYRAQGVYVDDDEIKRVVDFLENQAKPIFNKELDEKSAPEESSEPTTGNSGVNNDELFNQAVEIILTHQRGSVSLLQRKLGIGYTRAARLVDMMAEDGILGEYKGSKARDILITLEEWEILNNPSTPVENTNTEETPAEEPVFSSDADKMRVIANESPTKTDDDDSFLSVDDD